MKKLTPTARLIWCIRWPREDRPSEARQKYYMREAPAMAFLEALTNAGKEPQMFVTSTQWSEHPSNGTKKGTPQ